MEKVFEKDLRGITFIVDNNTDWNLVSCRMYLSEDQMEKYIDKINWIIACKFQILSEDFIRNHEDIINFDDISRNQFLSEKFIDEFKDRVNWKNISYAQKLSEDFIINHKDLIDWTRLSFHYNPSKEFVEKYGRDFLTDEVLPHHIRSSIPLDLDNKSKKLHFDLFDNMYETIDKDIKIRLIREEYECYDDYVIAYKVCRMDNYSFEYFGYKYDPGEIISMPENRAKIDTSIYKLEGIICRTFAGAINYAEGNSSIAFYKIMKVKAYYKDIVKVNGLEGFANSFYTKKLEVINEVII